MKTKSRAIVCLIALFSLLMQAGTPAWAGLNQKIQTPNHDYDVKFTDEDVADPDFFPASRAQDVADALDNNDPVFIGQPNGHHDGFVDRGFDAPDFNFNNKVLIKSSDNRGWADASKIVINSDWANGLNDGGTTETCLRKVTGHELFHHTQFSYIKFSNIFDWSNLVVEGMARSMEDKIYADLDAGACSHYLSEVINTQQTPNFPLWARSYDGALFWTYLAEQYGFLTAEPHFGVDFIETYLSNARDRDADVIGNLVDTLADFGETTDLMEIFRDFTIANVAREYDLSMIADADRYRYVDENDSSGQPAYQNVAKTQLTIPASDTGAVALWGARYYEATVPSACKGVVGFSAESVQGDAAGYNVLAVRNGAVERIEKGALNTTLDNRFAVAFPQDPTNPWEKLIAVVQGFNPGTILAGNGALPDLNADFDFTFDCGDATLTIITPNSGYPAYVGEPAAPERFNVAVSINGPASLGDAIVEGMDATDFTVWVGAKDPANEATVLTGTESGGHYILTVQPPVKMSDLSFPITVDYAGLAEATNNDAVRYEPLIIDQVIVLDRSDSMNYPLGDDKLAAAKAAGSAFIDASQSDDSIGVVSFNGNGFFSEPDNDSAINYALTLADDGSRIAAKTALNLITATGMTSIGDGLVAGLNEIQANGQADGDDWIVLLSDGAENEAAFYNDIAGMLSGSGTHVLAISFGGHTDQPLMQRIAEDTEGFYYHVPLAGANRAAAGSVDNTLGLADVFGSARERIMKHDRVWETQNSGSNVHSIDVLDSGLSDGRFTITWSKQTQQLDVAITRPDGTTLVDGVNDVRIYSDDQHIVVHAPLIEAGTWTMTTTAVTGNPAYFATLTGKSREGVQLDLHFDQTGVEQAIIAQGGTFQRGLPMRLLVVLTDLGGPVRGAGVTATIAHPESGSQSLPLYDDGKHDDGKAGDGVYANTYHAVTDGSPSPIPDDPTAAMDEGSFIVSIRADGVDNLGDTFARIEKGAFSVFEADGGEDDDFDGLMDVFEDRHGCVSSVVSDAQLDPDNDGLDNGGEYLAGTDPCSPDTDLGGEDDGSEVARGANPVDRNDDALRQPIDVDVVTVTGDVAMPAGMLAPNSNLIRYPVDAGYGVMLLYSAQAETGPFSLAASFDPRAEEGTFRHDSLPNDVPVWYYLVALDTAGHRSAPSRIFSGTPKDDPVAPGGFVSIDGGQSTTDSVNVTLHLGSAADTVGMRVSNNPRLNGVPAQPFSKDLPWTLEPRAADGMASVFVRFIDAAGNQSAVIGASIIVLPNASLGSITGTASLDGAGEHDGILVSVVGAAGIAPVLTDASGNFTLDELPPATYDLSFQRTGYLDDDFAGIVVTAGNDTNAGGATLLPIDADGDEIVDPFDNCLLVPNPAQRDSDGDLIGNLCDPDIATPNNCVVNGADLAALKVAGLTVPGDPAWNPDADFNGDNIVNLADRAILLSYMQRPPGPSGKTAVCTRTRQ